MKNKLLIIIVLFIIGSLAFILLSNQHGREKTAAVGLVTPGFEVLDPAGNRMLSYADLKGKVVFLNFWASWCPPCKEEMPSIEALYKEMSGNANFRMLTILYKDTYENGSGYMRANGYTFPVFIDNEGKSFQKFGLTGVPETYLIDKKGFLRKHVIGPEDWNSFEAKSLINSLLNE